MLFPEGSEFRFHVIVPHGDLEPAKFEYHEARKFIETHPVCANITHHDIRIIPHSEVQNILQGKSGESSAKSLALSSEEEDEEPLH
ncbi:MAG: hypothetical protein M0T70_05020 [Geobacteraceae bacterium]|nr:hypothetical protein [Geobacteraceae bacterium]